MWFGVSFKVSMSNTDQVVFQGNGNVLDLWSTGYSTPSEDASQNYDPSTGTLSDGAYSFSSLRALDTGDADQDMVLTCGNSYQMMWTGNKNTAFLEMHTNKGVFTLNLADDCTVGINEVPAGKVAQAEDNSDKEVADSGAFVQANVIMILSMLMINSS